MTRSIFDPTKYVVSCQFWPIANFGQCFIAESFFLVQCLNMRHDTTLRDIKIFLACMEMRGLAHIYPSYVSDGNVVLNLNAYIF